MESIIITIIVLAAAGYVGYVLTGVFRAKKGGGCRCTSAVCPYAGKHGETPCEKCSENGTGLLEIMPENTAEGAADKK